MIRIGVIGCGLMGLRRIQAIESLKTEGIPVEICGVHDIEAVPMHYPVFGSVENLLESGPDWVIVAVPHDVAVLIAIQALTTDVRVFMEKPMGRNLQEAEVLHGIGGKHLCVGMNYRFYPGVRQALNDARAGKFGKIISIEMVLAHGGKPGDEKSWKLDPVRAGGGALLDPGIHLLDLCRLISPGYLGIYGFTPMLEKESEREAHFLLTGGSAPVTLNCIASTVRWRSEFKLQFNGTEGYGIVTGRGGHYGLQHYITGKRWAWREGGSQRSTETHVLQSDCVDVFTNELRHLFSTPVNEQEEWPGVCTSAEALETMRLYHRIRDRL